MADLLYFLANAADFRDVLLFSLVLRAQRVRVLLCVGELFLEMFETLHARLVLFELQRRFFDFELHDAPVRRVELGRKRVDVGAYHRAGFVDKVDGLVWQKPVRDVAVREHRRRDERAVLDAHAVVDLEAFLEAAQNRDGVLDARRLYEHRLETPLERRVFLYILAVLFERRRADAVQLAAREQRLQHVARVERAVGLSGSDYRVQLVYEEDDASVALLDFVEHCFEPFLELAAELRACDERAHVEREDDAVLEVLRHVAAHDSHRKPFGYSRLADARLAYQHGVVLRLAAQYAYRAANLLVASDDRVELVLARGLHEVAPVFFKRVVGVLGVVARHALVAAHFGKRLEEIVRRNSEGLEYLTERAALRLVQYREEDVLDRYVLVLEAVRLVLGAHQNLRKTLRDVDFAAFLTRAGNLRLTVQLVLYRSRYVAHGDVHFFEKPRNEPVLLLYKSESYVFGVDLLVSVADGEVLRVVKSFLRLLRKFIHIHMDPSLQVVFNQY